MSEYNFDIKKTCAVTGHREMKWDLDKLHLKEIFLSLIKKGYDTFLCGMALGFDTLCFKILEEIREKNDIKIVACIPCKTQDKSFSKEEKENYAKMVCSADKVILVSENYTPYCMQKRNVFMVDNSSILVAYLKQLKGGTFNTVQYADKMDKEIIRV